MSRNSNFLLYRALHLVAILGVVMGSLLGGALPFSPPKPVAAQDGQPAQAGQVEAVDGVQDTCVTVKGTVRREKRMPTVTGLGGPVLIPLDHARLEIREDDDTLTFGDDTYGHAYTGADGSFSRRFCDDDGLFGGDLEIYLRICSEVWDNETLITRVTNTKGELYCFDTGIQPSGGNDVTFNLDFTESNPNGRVSEMTGIWNIATGIYDAWKYWVDNGGPRPAIAPTVIYERGNGTGSSELNGRIRIGGNTSAATNPDYWDDTVIMHEWGHFIDEQLSCSASPGGAHTLNGPVADPRLSWGEAWGDYFQAAVRARLGRPNAAAYVDITGRGYTGAPPPPPNPLFWIDVENPANAAAFSNPVVSGSVLIEGSVAAMLWDFMDGVNDGQDTVQHGHGMIANVFTAPAFRTTLDGANFTCTAASFLRTWRAQGNPTDAATAATVTQNTGLVNQFNSLAASAAGAASPSFEEAVPPVDGGYRWWDQLTMVVDNSASMAQPPATPKLGAVKTVIAEQINDAGTNPQGVDSNLYAFNNTGLSNQTVFEGQFYPNQITPLVNGLTAATDPDAECTVYGLPALRQGAANKFNSNIWLYTDGDNKSGSPEAQNVAEFLRRRGLQGSVVLLGGCAPQLPKQSDVTGAEKNVLGLAADGKQPVGIVPYLLTALGTGGQFLYVGADQLDKAGEILRAQLSNSAGAGRWSDYVSDLATYRYDRLTPGEYAWVDATPAGGGTHLGELSTGGGSVAPRQVIFPQPIPFFGNPIAGGWVQPDGYILMGNALDAPTVDVLYGAHKWGYDDCPPRAAASATGSAAWTTNTPAGVDLCSGWLVELYSKLEGDWYTLSTMGETVAGSLLHYQTLFNTNTGEIRFQYNAVTSADAGISEIGLTNGPGNQRVPVVNRDVNGAASGTGYKFVPAPPQPTKTYTVSVDALMTGVAFLQTGYSGSFDPITVTYPDGSPVSCADTQNVLCLTLHNAPGDNMVQYVQVNVNGQGGDYHAVIGAGPSGEGTFTFNALAASDVRTAVEGDRSRSLGASRFILDLGRAAAGNTLDGWLQLPNGARFGTGFMLYDDGAHEDGPAGDGRFGSELYTPAAAGLAYLWIRGTVDGEEIVRADPTPFNFQPLEFEAQQPEIPFYGSTQAAEVAAPFAVTNTSDRFLCYNFSYDIPQGWTAAWANDGFFCLQPNTSALRTLNVRPALDNAPNGSSGDVIVTISEAVEGTITASAGARVSRQRLPVLFEWDNRYADLYIRPGDAISVTVLAWDENEHAAQGAENTVYTLNTTSGSLQPSTPTFHYGRLEMTYTAGPDPVDAVLSFTPDGGETITTTMSVQPSRPYTVNLTATPADLSGTVSKSMLVVTVADDWGDPVAGRMVRLNVGDDDGNQGTVAGGDVYTGTTNAQGKVSVEFVRGATAAGEVWVRAEVLQLSEGVYRVTHEDSRRLILPGGGGPVVGNQDAYLPLLVRGSGSNGNGQPRVELAVYDDAPAAGWQDWSWNCTVDLDQGARVHDGAKAIAVTYGQTSAGLSLRAPVAIDATQYSAIRFWVYGSAGGNALRLYTEASDDAGPQSAAHDFTAPANTWTQITVALATLGNPALIKRINLQNNAGGAQAKFYVDEIELLK